MHAVDLVHPGSLEFYDFNVAEDIDGYEKSVRELLSIEWQILSPGHSNIGARSDVQLVLDYLSDIRTHIQDAMSETAFGLYVQEDKIFSGRDHRQSCRAHAAQMGTISGILVGFIVTNLSRAAERVTWFYNQRGYCKFRGSIRKLGAKFVHTDAYEGNRPDLSPSAGWSAARARASGLIAPAMTFHNVVGLTCARRFT